MSGFYNPTPEQVAKLSQPWSACYSGGKDSTSLVTWVEWLRRSGRIDVPTPKLIRSDTGVEDPALTAIAEELTGLLERCDWRCALVRPALDQKLYNRILGIGNPPVHAGISRMRWCTRSTKIDPMDARRKREITADELSLTGLRIGESDMRDLKLKRAGCAAGGECGIPDPGQGTYSPILHWRTCQVIDWLGGTVEQRIRDLMPDVFAVTKHLVDIYGVVTAKTLFDERQVLSAARFGCIGCPAISVERYAPKSVVRRNGEDSPLNELYDVWYEARRRANRCYRPGKPEGGRAKLGGYGPIRMEVRKRLFDRVMDIQSRAGVTLITSEDEAFIRECWETRRYPRGWSEADESVMPPDDLPLLVERTNGSSAAEVFLP
jgi:DNA sulfur modification protein DndC